jgi:hypothetical protein
MVTAFSNFTIQFRHLATSATAGTAYINYGALSPFLFQTGGTALTAQQWVRVTGLGSNSVPSLLEAQAPTTIGGMMLDMMEWDDDPNKLDQFNDTTDVAMLALFVRTFTELVGNDSFRLVGDNRTRELTRTSLARELRGFTNNAILGAGANAIMRESLRTGVSGLLSTVESYNTLTVNASVNRNATAANTIASLTTTVNSRADNLIFNENLTLTHTSTNTVQNGLVTRSQQSQRETGTSTNHAATPNIITNVNLNSSLLTQTSTATVPVTPPAGAPPAVDINTLTPSTTLNFDLFNTLP